MKLASGLGLVGVFFLFSCSSPQDLFDKGSGSRPVINEQDPQYQNALTFDRWVKGTLDSDAEKSLKRSCRTHPKENPFCFSVLNSRALDKKIQAKIRIPKPPKAKPIRPIIAKFNKKGKLLNMRQLRAAPVPSLLKGIDDLPLDTLDKLAKLALKEERCPVNIAVAVAATLEDYLPDRTSVDQLATLYDKAANCARYYPVDREHFMTRAGLFHFFNKNYEKAARLFARVNPTDAFMGRALFWLYRSKIALGDKEGAYQALEKLKARHPFSFHSIMSRLATNQDPGESALAPQELAPKRSHRNPSVNRLIEQTEILQKFGFEESAAILVDWALKDYSRVESDVKLYVASLGDAHAKVTTVPELLILKPSFINRETMALSYPKAYFSLFDKYHGSVDPFLLLAVARHESSFNPKAISPANAQGLMQLNPKMVPTLGEIPLPEGNNGELLDPEFNILVGAKYLKLLLGKLDDELTLALAAYNAGEAPVETWRKRYATSDPLLFVDLMPYRETRDYVAYVLANYYWYRRIHSQNPDQPFQKLLRN